jgi:outer membrane protein insertion porin family
VIPLNIYVKEYPLINSVELEGEKSNTVKKSVLERLSLKSSGSFIESSLNEDVNLLKKIYASIGFNFAQVEAKIEKFSNNRINLIYVLDKGKKTDIKKINFIGDKKIKRKKIKRHHCFRRSKILEIFIQKYFFKFKYYKFRQKIA